MISKIIALIIFVIFSPLFIIISIAIYVDDGFPVFYNQRRVGLNNSIFKLYKFRSMKRDIPDIPTHLVENPTLLYTRCGPFLRKYSIDELPQLINIIKGEMVFIGPRPALHNQDDLVALRVKLGIHKLTPGVTGWAQVNGRDELSIPKKVQCDEYYLKNRSLFLNAKIILLTILKVLGRDGVSH